MKNENQEKFDSKCVICLEFMIRPMITGCNHVFCERCICQLLSGNNPSAMLCPSCRDPIRTVKAIQSEDDNTNLMIKFRKQLFSFPCPEEKSVHQFLSRIFGFSRDRIRLVSRGKIYSDDEIFKTIQKKTKTRFLLIASNEILNEGSSSTPSDRAVTSVWNRYSGGRYQTIWRRLYSLVNIVPGVFLLYFTTLVRPFEFEEPNNMAPPPMRHGRAPEPQRRQVQDSDVSTIDFMFPRRYPHYGACKVIQRVHTGRDGDHSLPMGMGMGMGG